MKTVMRSGELKRLVLIIIREEGPLSIRNILNSIRDKSKNDYAYTTIATIVKRLEQKNIVIANQKLINNRFTYEYSLSQDAPKDEIKDILHSLINRFGTVGIRHLGKVFNEDLTEEDILRIKQQFEELETTEG